MLPFFSILLIAVILLGWLTYKIHRKNAQYDKTPNKALNLDNLPASISTEQENLLQKVADFSGSNIITPYNIKTFLADKITENFAKMSGWDKWTADYHIMPRQEERQRSALNSQIMSIVSLDKTKGQACVHGESGLDYNIDSNGCSCSDFQTRQLPCKHMYFVSFQVNDDKE